MIKVILIHDGIIDPGKSPVFSHRIRVPIGIFVQLKIVDTSGCYRTKFNLVLCFLCSSPCLTFGFIGGSIVCRRLNVGGNTATTPICGPIRHFCVDYCCCCILCCCYCKLHTSRYFIHNWPVLEVRGNVISTVFQFSSVCLHDSLDFFSSVTMKGIPWSVTSTFIHKYGYGYVLWLKIMMTRRDVCVAR